MHAQHCLVNGQATDLVSSRDRGLLYGDGLFETMAVIAGKIPLWKWHMGRLQRGCQRLNITCPQVDVLRAEVELLARGEQRAIIKLILTRGQGGRGYAPQTDDMSTRIVQRHAWPELPRAHWEVGVKVITCQLQLARQPLLAGIKHLNRLEQILARAEWHDPVIQEGLLRDSEGYIIEAISHNIFLLQGQTLITPDLSQCGVAGVMRDYLLSILQEQGYDVQVALVTRQELLAADALFLCNSIHGIWPICELDGKRFELNPLVCELRDTVAKSVPYP